MSRVFAALNIQNSGFIVGAALLSLAAHKLLHWTIPQQFLALAIANALLGDGAHPVPVAPARHRGQCARRRRRAAGLQPCQLHGRADPVGDDPAPGALRHVLQDLQHPGDALDLPHRQGDPERRCARRPGIDAARVRRDRCRAG
ncbi:hypothetical protein G6F24_016742 [Rhizopus arrhizus]|nr:hypothetical protein G6F24_016742 [Rhizopus arrhizus]